MANFIARIELHSATWDDYEVLHTAMVRRGFSRSITANDGRRYKLPTGTYIVERTTSVMQAVFEAATQAAEETGKKSWVIVADWTGAKWKGLPSIQP